MGSAVWGIWSSGIDRQEVEMNAGAQLTFSFWFSLDPSSWNGPTYILGGSFHFRVPNLEIVSQEYAQMIVSKVTVNTVKLIIIIKYNTTEKGGNFGNCYISNS